MRNLYDLWWIKCVTSKYCHLFYEESVKRMRKIFIGEFKWTNQKRYKNFENFLSFVKYFNKNINGGPFIFYGKIWFENF